MKKGNRTTLSCFLKSLLFAPTSFLSLAVGSKLKFETVPTLKENEFFVLKTKTRNRSKCGTKSKVRFEKKFGQKKTYKTPKRVCYYLFVFARGKEEMKIEFKNKEELKILKVPGRISLKTRLKFARIQL